MLLIDDLDLDREFQTLLGNLADKIDMHIHAGREDNTDSSN